MVEPGRLRALAVAARRRFAPVLEAADTHRRRALLGLGAALLLTSAAAYALAEIQPDLPARSVVAVSVGNDAPAQTRAIDGADIVFFRSTDVRRQDTVQRLLGRLGVTDPDAVARLAADPRMRVLVSAGAGPEPVRAQVTGRGELLRLAAALPLPRGDAPDFRPVWRELEVRPDTEGGLTVAAVDRPVAVRARLATVVVHGPLSRALLQAGVPQSIGAQVGKVFAPQLDLHRGLAAGDRVSLVYEMHAVDGREVRPGRLLAAEIRTHGRTLQAVWFAVHGDSRGGGYFTPAGQGLEKVWASSPLPGARVTSAFGMRMHPVNRRREMHEGVDLAARLGTPIPSVADGRVTFAGVQNGYGNVVKIGHPGGYETVYAHLDSIAVRRGQAVAGGQVIGKSGATGTSTGPHLHFEFHVAGRLANPLQMARYVPQGRPLPPGEKASFYAATALLRTQLAQASGDDAVRLARVD